MTAANYPLCRGRLDRGRRPAVQLVKTAVEGCPRGRGLVKSHLPPLEFFPTRRRRLFITQTSFLVGRRVQVFNVGVLGCGDIFRGNFVGGLCRLDKKQALFLSTLEWPHSSTNVKEREVKDIHKERMNFLKLEILDLSRILVDFNSNNF